MNYALKSLLGAILCGAGWVAAAFGQTAAPRVDALAELQGKQRAALVVTYLPVVDAGDPERAVLAAALRADKPPSGRVRRVFAAVARPLNDYAKKSKQLIPVRKVSEAEYVFCFNYLGYRRVLDTFYPYGELFVIVKTADGAQPSGRVVWRTEKPTFADDAMRNFLRALKTLHGKT